MNKFVVWFNERSTKNPTYEIITARTGDDAKKILLTDKRYTVINILTVNLYRG